jgi:ring-1,2-phenylacetyl-CoA epoxidase subunit PaaE
VATHFRSLKIKDIRKETADCVSVAFEIPEHLASEFEFSQGQNITVKSSIEGEELRRSYSICSSPMEKELRIAIKQIPSGKFSTHANQALSVGHMLDVMAPTGKFFTKLSSAHEKQYLAFVAGSGITPVISIIKATLSLEPRSSFTLVYGNRDRHTIIFKEQLENLKDRYLDRLMIHHIFSREKTDAAINQGRIDGEKCRQLFQHLIDPKRMDEIFICGPESMIFSVIHCLDQEKIPKEKIHFELFTVPGQATGAPTKITPVDLDKNAKESRISIKIDGISSEFSLSANGPSILDAALRQGADLPYACKGGVCASCRAWLKEGKVHMDTNYALEADELAAGFILTCQSHPRTPIVTVDFDHK